MRRDGKYDGREAIDGKREMRGPCMRVGQCIRSIFNEHDIPRDAMWWLAS